MIIKWKIFQSSEEFEKWQVENPKFHVLTMQPFCKGSQFKGWEGQISDNEKTSEVNTENHWAVFVTFAERERSGPQTM